MSRPRGHVFGKADTLNQRLTKRVPQDTLVAVRTEADRFVASIEKHVRAAQHARSGGTSSFYADRINKRPADKAARSASHYFYEKLDTSRSASDNAMRLQQKNIILATKLAADKQPIATAAPNQTIAQLKKKRQEEDTTSTTTATTLMLATM